VWRGSADNARSAWQRASFRKCAIGQQHSEHAEQNGKPAKYEQAIEDDTERIYLGEL
jgi:hypothetical protein